MDVGFVLALPLHHGDLDNVGVLTKDHVPILVAWPWLGGPICEIIIPVQELQLKMKGGLIREGGHYGINLTLTHTSLLIYRACITEVKNMLSAPNLEIFLYIHKG